MKSSLHSNFRQNGSIYVVGTQAVVLMFRITKQYLAVIPGTAACFCLLATDLSNPGVYTGTPYSCECLVPGEDDEIFLMTDDTSAVDSVIIIYNLS